MMSSAAARKHSMGILIFTVLTVLLGGCSASQVVDLHTAGSGTAEVTIQLHPAFADYLEDLTATLGTAPGAMTGESEIFDLTAIAAGFAAEPGIDLLSATSPDRETLHLHVRFAPLPGIISQRESVFTEVLDFTPLPRGRRQMTVRLNSVAVARLLRFAGIDPFVAESLLPPSGDMTAAEYLEYLVWALEEYHPAEELRRIIPDSAVDSRVQVAGTIQTQRGGRLGGDRTKGAAVFTTPLLTLLTTAQPVEYVIIFDTQL